MPPSCHRRARTPARRSRGTSEASRERDQPCAHLPRRPDTGFRQGGCHVPPVPPEVCEHGSTWIKPSFLWMVYRCGWGTKEGQETVLAVEITRDGFDWALRNACLSHYVRGLHTDRAAWQRDLKRAPARVQWDPERDLHLRPLPHRSLQLGLSGEASARYAEEWIVSISDVTPLAHEIHALVRDGDPDAATRLFPPERAYPAGDELLAHLCP
ncbi:DUF4291 domain-containing protein [Streptomyces sp. NPDC059215]|uniref:DUF4291 domain-containing protein n=1 Tax=Streptomyces sp. NPDC059215 TaxID=3346772 RepID=UPI0036CACD5E